MCERKYRHELKHYINHADYLAIRRRLREIAPLDRFSGRTGATPSTASISTTSTTRPCGKSSTG